MRDAKLHAVVAQTQVKRYKTRQLRSTFRNLYVEKVNSAVARRTFGRQNVQNTPCLEHFWKLRCSKSARRCGAAVARSTVRSQNVQSTPCSEHSWQLRCSKGARRCGTKHMSKSKCTKHTLLGALLAVEMFKRCTPL